MCISVSSWRWSLSDVLGFIICKIKRAKERERERKREKEKERTKKQKTKKQKLN